MERADFTAKLACASIDFSLRGAENSKKFMAAALFAIGEYGNFRKIHASGAEMNGTEFLVSSNCNPSSIVSSAERARKNLETSFAVLPPEILSAALKFVRTAEALAGDFSRIESIETELLDIRKRFAETHGIAHGHLLRGGAYEFWQTGRMIERMSTIARSVDLGFNLASSLEEEIASEAFAMGYFANFGNNVDLPRNSRGEIDEAAILNFFILDPMQPLSLAFAVREIEKCLRCLGRIGSDARTSVGMAENTAELIRSATADLILGKGISEFARETIQACFLLSNQIEFDFEFDSPK